MPLIHHSPPVKPDQDHNSYHPFHLLHNGLTVLNIHDPNADKSAVSMTVRVGHLQDPDDLPGLAHYIEHMMSQGTKPFPGDSEFKHFLSQHGGRYNASTGMEYTTYYFDVLTEFLPQALERFSAMFISPLFDFARSQRELNNIDSEFQLKYEDDGRRLFQLLKSTCNQAHEFRKFSCGNVATLGGATRDQLVSHFKRFYVANNMALAIVSSCSPCRLEELVVEHFHDVACTKGFLFDHDMPHNNRANDNPHNNHANDNPHNNHANDSPPVFPAEATIPTMLPPHPWSPEAEYLGRITRVRAVKNLRVVKLYFPLPPSRPASRGMRRFLSHVLGHEGPSSLLAVLKQRDLASALSAGMGHATVSWALYCVSVTLAPNADTPEGVNTVCSLVFQFLQLLMGSPQALLRRRFQQAAQIALYQFHYRSRREPIDTVRAIGQQLHVAMIEHPEAHVSCGLFDHVLDSWLTASEFSPTEWSLLYTDLTPARCQIFHLSKSHDAETESTWISERWYTTSYTVSKIQNLDLASGTTSMEINGENDFVVSDFTVLSPTPSITPTLLSTGTHHRVFHLRDTARFPTPKTCIFMRFHHPLDGTSPRHTALARMLADILREAVKPDLYDARIAGLQYSIGAFSLEVYGFHENAGRLLHRLLFEREGLQRVDIQMFLRLQEKALRSLRNRNLRRPVAIAGSHLSYFLKTTSFPPDAVADELEKLTVEDVERFSTEVSFARGDTKQSIEMLFHGNCTAEESTATAQLVLEQLHLKNNSSTGGRFATTSSPSLVRKLGNEQDHGRLVINVRPGNDNEKNVAVVVCVQVGPATSTRDRAYTSLLAQLMRQSAFGQLRTKEKLGYVVSTVPTRIGNVVHLKLSIQSKSHGPDHITARIEAFLQNYEQTLREMETNVFEQHKRSLLKNLEIPPYTLMEANDEFIARLRQGDYCWDGNDRLINALKQMHQEEVVEFHRTMVCPGGRLRRVLVVQVHNVETWASRQGGVDFEGERIERLKWGAECFPP